MTNHHKNGGTNTTKDVIYIDVDDEITAIIDKVQSSDKKIVALVLPKRATVLQSIVNMKLLKRSSAEAKKSLVLITAETGLMPLAGSVGFHVAKSLNSKPEVPDAPERASSKVDTVDETDDESDDVALDEHQTVGELSGNAAGPMDDDDTDETIELDDEEHQTGKDSSVKGKLAKLKKFKIPNFNKFRVLLALTVVGVIVLSMVGYAALAVWPKATITIKTNSEAVNASAILTLKAGADTKLDAKQGIILGQIQEVKKTLTQEAPATGQQNNGEKATGTAVMTAKDCSPPYKTPDPLPAGSGITSSGNTYITQEKATFGIDGASDCVYYKANTVNIVAQSGGTKFNISSATFTVSGRSDVAAAGSASGGTDNITKIVTQADIDGAKQKITEQDTKPIQQELKSALIGRSLFAIEVTFGIGTPETKLSVEANVAAEAVTVTQTIAYTMLGVKQEDLEKVVAASVADKIDDKKQSILSHGLADAFFSLQGVNADGASVSIQATVVAGAELNTAAIKKQVAGKKAGDAKELISENPGVTDVVVTYSPFWVSSIPKNTSKITVVVQEPKVTSGNEQSSP
jgi:hypothetical protein